jgi:hypothetical protein
MMTKPHTYIMYLVLFSTWLLVLYMAYLMLYPITISTVTNYKILNDKVKQGETITYEIDYCKYSDIQGQRDRAFINDIVYTITPDTTNVPTGCHKAVNTINIPRELPPGVYKVRNTISYRINPFRTEQTSFTSNEFEVQKNENYS